MRLCKFTVRSLNKDQQRGTAVLLGDIFSDVHPQMRRTQIQCALCSGNQRTSVVACDGTKCPLRTLWDLGPPPAASSKKTISKDRDEDVER